MKRRGQGVLLEQLRHSNKANRKINSDEAVQTWLHLTRGNKTVLPPRFRHEDVRASENMLEFFLNEFTEKGQLVFDPFAGFGTILLVAEEMGRVGYGIEYSKSKADYVHGLLDHPEHLSMATLAISWIMTCHSSTYALRHRRIRMRTMMKIHL